MSKQDDVADGWVWMTHPSYRQGRPIPVEVFTVEGYRFYRPFDDWAPEFDWNKKDDAWNVVAYPSLPVREEPTRVALRELLTAETAEYPPASAGMAAQTAWAERRAQARDQARAVLASSPSVQNRGEGETGKDGVTGRKP